MRVGKCWARVGPPELGRLDGWVGMGRKRRITVEEIDDTSAAEPRSRRRSAKASPAPSPRRAALAQATARTSATGERLRAAAQSGNETELRAVLEPLEPGDPALDAVDWYLRPTLSDPSPPCRCQ